MADRTGKNVHRPKQHESLIESLCTGQDKDERPSFESYRDLMLYAAALGWSKRRREPFSTSDKVIEWDTQINRKYAEDVVDILAYGETEDIDVLDPQRLSERVRIFEEYANGGLLIIQEAIDGESLRPDEAVLRLLDRELGQHEKSNDEDVPDLSNLLAPLGLDDDAQPS